MLHIGCHLSASKGYYDMGKTALKLGGDTFQFFTRNPRGSQAKAINEEDVAKFLALAKENHFPCILAHAPYTLNACSDKVHTREFAWQTMADDLKRMEYTPGNLYNFHPGSHMGQGSEAGVSMIAAMLNEIMTTDQTTTVLLETMAGKGSEVGGHFEELKAIIDETKLDQKIGVCLDTCHVFDGGYDIVGDLDGVVREFDRIIGLDRLKAIHINDSKNEPNSHKDRHEKIGEGHIGLDALTGIINHPDLRHLPFYLETPNELEGYAREIALLKSKYVE